MTRLVFLALAAAISVIVLESPKLRQGNDCAVVKTQTVLVVVRYWKRTLDTSILIRRKRTATSYIIPVWLLRLWIVGVTPLVFRRCKGYEFYLCGRLEM